MACSNWSELPRPGGTNFKIAAENIVMLDTQSVLLTTYNQDDRAANKLVPTEIWRCAVGAEASRGPWPGWCRAR